jgi:CDP-diacylglycerol--serine O-phosphatidyltransferase
MGIDIKKRLSWVPNLFTLGNLWLGFFSCIFSLQVPGDERYLTIAGTMIILAALLDGLDGFMARLLNAQSAIGAQLDSLADLTTFGIAPGILFYSLLLNDFRVAVTDSVTLPLGMFLAGLYPAAVAFRLARFNVSHEPGVFEGVPSPVGGMIVALMPLAFQDAIFMPGSILIVIFVITAYLMVSTIRYSKVQVALFRRFSLLRGSLLIAFALSLVIFLLVRFGIQYAAAFLFALILLYIVSGIISFLIHLIQEYRI